MTWYKFNKMGVSRERKHSFLFRTGDRDFTYPDMSETDPYRSVNMRTCIYPHICERFVHETMSASLKETGTYLSFLGKNVVSIFSLETEIQGSQLMSKLHTL